jgi:DNA-binding response OmpR family regulator
MIRLGHWNSPAAVAATSRRFPRDIIVCTQNRALATGGVVTIVGPQNTFRLALLLLGRGGRVTTKAEMIDALYGDHIDGGPENATRNVDVQLTRARGALAAVGAIVEREGYRGVIVRRVRGGEAA